MYTLVENDVGIELQVTCTEGTEFKPVDLTGCTVNLIWVSVGEKQTRPMNLIDPVAGIVSYIFLATEITAPDMVFELQIVNAAGQSRSSLQTFRERVREKL